MMRELCGVAPTEGKINMRETPAFVPADILLPQGVEMGKWSTIACDQFSSEPAYWARVEKFVGDAPSTLRMMLPEAWLEGADLSAWGEKIAGAMSGYQAGGVLKPLENSFIYIERTLTSGRVRRGLVGALDLEAYEYTKGTKAAVRASENTVIDRLPPRIAMRKAAPLELPHIMVLIDDPDKGVIEPLSQTCDRLETVYDFDLMEGGGHIRGHRVSGVAACDVQAQLQMLALKTRAKYGDRGALMIIGDGNHSLAAAKSCWDEIKGGLSDEERKNHPARFALVELTNLHDPSLEIEPIHRIVFDQSADLSEKFVQACPHAEFGAGTGYHIGFLSKEEEGSITVSGLTIGQTIGALQEFLDAYVQENGGSIDYIHGDDSVRQLAGAEDCVGFFMPAVEKGDLFPSVIEGGVFPKKSFSMGHARDKRYYLEARAI